MKLRSKDYIPLSTKREVWLRQCHPYDNRICQCATCDTILLSISSLRNQFPEPVSHIYFHDGYNSIRIKPVPMTHHGHIRMEKNNGSVDVDNLVIQCSDCNQSKYNKIDIPEEDMKRDILMIDVNY